jgi:tRNA(Ile)-lysidine synthase
VRDKQAASLEDAFERALGEIRVRVSAFGQPIAVAYSGGLDSTALLHLAHAYARTQGIALFAFHVHHGLSPNADGWLRHCETECARLGISFDARRIVLAHHSRDGVEQAARIGRYAALGDLCRVHGMPLLLTAHHQDDQAETVLLQLLRGSGVAGLSGMEQANTAPDLLGNATTMIARPLLGVARVELERFVARNAIRHVEDESNADPRHTRNALRHQVMPALAANFPGYQQRFARAALHAQAAQRMLGEMAALDLQVCADGDRIDIGKLKHLSADRIENLLRHWFGVRGVRMPSTAWLAEMRTQLLSARVDAQVRITHADCEIRRHRGKIFLTPRVDGDTYLSEQSLTFRWQGEAHMHFPSFGGNLYFDAADEGADPAWLAGQDLQVRYRSGGERLKSAPNRPTRSLKHHYQTLDIPAWERLRLPVVLAAGQLVFAAGIGMHWWGAHAMCKPGIRLRWENDT